MCGDKCVKTFNVKNVLIYRLTRDINLDAKAIEAALAPMAFTPCASQDMSRSGWTAPIATAGSLIHAANGYLLMRYRREQKILPAAVIQKHLHERIAKLEQEQCRKLKKTEKDALRDEILHSLLPRAFTRTHQSWLWIDTAKKIVMVDAASAKKAEDILSLLRKSLGSLPVVPLTMKTPIELTLTQWVRTGKVPAGFTLGDEAELKAILEDGGIIRTKQQDVDTDEITVHIEAGKMVTKLAMGWNDRLQFVLDDNGTIKRLKFSDALLYQNDDIDPEDAAQRFDADFVLLSGELSVLIANLVTALGEEASA
ncbi:recombination-associated protein RdgC [Edwardsiella tarda]|uniref:recombination-associated protein RdgC n=1 Tax=Edwardsiella tarda TaxID=636 RepID=UPI000FD9FC04